MNLQEAAQQALEALEKHDAYCRNGIPQTWFDFVGKPAIIALRAALAKPEQEPVAWCVAYDDPLMGRIHSNPTMYQPEAKALIAQADSPLSLISLYPSSLRREPLTDEELVRMWQAIDHGKIGHTINFARAIERAHGIGGEE